MARGEEERGRECLNFENWAKNWKKRTIWKIRENLLEIRSFDVVVDECRSLLVRENNNVQKNERA